MSIEPSMATNTIEQIIYSDDMEYMRPAPRVRNRPAMTPDSSSAYDTSVSTSSSDSREMDSIAMDRPRGLARYAIIEEDESPPNGPRANHAYTTRHDIDEQVNQVAYHEKQRLRKVDRELQKELERDMEREREIAKRLDGRSNHGEEPIPSYREMGSSSGGSMSAYGMANTAGNHLADFYSDETFRIVLHNPATAHRFLRFCQSRACGESMEFLQQIDAYVRLLDQTMQLLSTVHTTYTSPAALSPLPASPPVMKNLAVNLRQAVQSTLPSLEDLFSEAQEQVQAHLAKTIYPRFVKHQVTLSATTALSNDISRFQGLGDCFCLTSPARADNPILFASDGFVQVTGYSRRDIIPRNCRFLQGAQTDQVATRRLKEAIEAQEETVELLLNYRKDGSPFWNLLYVAPLVGEHGDVDFYLGGQINCSTSIYSCVDVLRVLSAKEEYDDEIELAANELSKQPSRSGSTPGAHTKDGKGSGSATPKDAGRNGAATANPRSNFFKSWRKYAPSRPSAQREPSVASIHVRPEAGMENELITRVGRMSFKMQVEAFYTAYSKYLVLAYPGYKPCSPDSSAACNPPRANHSATRLTAPVAASLNSFTLPIHYYSSSLVDLLIPSPPAPPPPPSASHHVYYPGTPPNQMPTMPDLIRMDIFALLASPEYSSATSSFHKSFKNTVKTALEAGKAVSVETGLLTAWEEVPSRRSNGERSSGGGSSTGRRLGSFFSSSSNSSSSNNGSGNGTHTNGNSSGGLLSRSNGPGRARADGYETSGPRHQHNQGVNGASNPISFSSTGSNGGGGAHLGRRNTDVEYRRVEERYVCHWTPVKDEEAKVGWVVLTIAPRV